MGSESTDRAASCDHGSLGEQRPRRKPTVRIDLAPEEGLPREFVPLKAPRQLAVELGELTPDLVEELTAELKLVLNPGRYDLPLAEELPLRVEIPADVECKAWVSVGQTTAGDDGQAMVSGAGLSFDQPLVIRNVVPILSQLPTLFEDRQLAQALEVILALTEPTAASSRVRRFGRTLRELHDRIGPRPERWLPEESRVRQGVERVRGIVSELQAEPERLVNVLLRYVTIRPVSRGGQWRLDLRFSGEVTYLGRVEMEFSEVLVPPPILPAPHALLERLLSPEPLATAHLRRDRLAPERLLAALSEVVSTFSGRFSGILEVPRVAIDIHVADGGVVSVEGATRDPARVQGSFDGSATTDEIRLATPDLQLRLGGESMTLAVDTVIRAVDEEEEATVSPARRSVFRRWLAWLRHLQWPPPDLTFKLEASIQPGSRAKALSLAGCYRHPLTVGGTTVPLVLQDLKLNGSLALTVTPHSQGWPRHRGELAFAAQFEVPEGGSIADGRSCLSPLVREGRLAGRATWTDDVGLELTVQSEADFALAGRTAVEAFPELDIDEGELSSHVAGKWHLDARARTSDLTQPLVEADFSNTWCCAVVEEAWLELGQRRLDLPAASSVEAKVTDAVLATSGLGRGAIEVGWDLQGESPLLRGTGAAVELLVEDLRSGTIGIQISPAGGLTITGEEAGLYDAHFFNALVNPGSEPTRWWEILLDDEAIEHVLAAVRIFSTDAATLLGQIRRFALQARDAADAEGIEQPRDLLPGRTIATMISRLLCESDELSDQLYPLVKRVTDGDGLDVPAIKRILTAQLGEHDYDYEVDRALRWLARVLDPTEPVPPRLRRAQPALVDDPRFVGDLAELPSAGSIYRTVDDSRPLPAEFAERLAQVAPYLTLEQLQYITARDRDDWPDDVRARLQYIGSLKERIHLISENYGGLSFAPQAIAIGFFLGEVARIRAAGSADGSTPEGVLGPQDVAVLLQASLASAWQGRTVQLNRRLLFDLVLARPPAFLHEVLVEMAGASSRALAGVLYALLNPEQGQMEQPLNMADALSKALGIVMPRLEDYLAGGRWAKHSYWEALAKAAEQVLADAEPYLAKKAHLQVQRHAVATPLEPTAAASPLVEHAELAIARADAAGARCTFAPPSSHDEALEAYQRAFRACAELLTRESQAFQLPWFKHFWSRNFEALVVRSVVRNAQQNVDDVRRWLQVRSGQEPSDDEQQLIDTVVDALYYEPDDRARLKADPLVRLLVDPPAGRYDFTIISAMGVITEGERGRELEEAYERLEAERGIRTIRANTATARSLEHNAARIEEAARQATTPWGYIGYSQGCANGLQAESRLLGGTPEQQELAERLVARNLLFSAINGSAHGTCGDWKFLRAMAEADRFLKHYQAVLSRQAIRFAVDNLKLSLDSRLFVHVMGGVESLSYEGVRPLGRDGQFKASIPTAIMRGIVEDDTMPEALEFLSNALSKQLESSLHDTQVAAEEAVGHPVQVDNASARLLERCDMGAMVQRTHHWSPLSHETEFVTTVRDRERAIYDYPKDRHVFPWVEINARFGLIRRTDEPE